VSPNNAYPRTGEGMIRRLRDEWPEARGEVLDLAYELRQEGLLSDSEWTAIGREAMALAYELVAADELDGFLALLTGDVEFTSMIAEVEGEVYQGHDGVRRWWAAVRHAFDDVHYEMLSFQRYDDERSVSLVRVVGSLGGVPVEQSMWQAITTRGGRASWWSFFRSREDAVSALLRRSCKESRVRRSNLE
jgi:SnoaL-like domain